MGELPFERIKREILVRKDVVSGGFGHDPENRKTTELMECSIVCIDKPKGPTSHQVSSYVQDILGVEKGGHSGTLDPKVTGVLPVAIGKATRIVQAMLPAGKEYICVMHVHQLVSEDKVREAMAKFVGKIKQLPPIKSAVKRDWRFRKVYYIEIHEIIEQDVLFTVGCQAGTYIRKLCHDIGQELGVGAHMTELLRTKAGSFNLKNICSLQDLTDAVHYYKNDNNDNFIRKLLQPIERGVDHLGKVFVLDSSVDTLCHGASLAIPGISKIESDICNEEMVAVLTLRGELIGIGKSRMTSQEMMEKESGIAVSIDAVFMQPGTYPKMQPKKN